MKNSETLPKIAQVALLTILTASFDLVAESNYSPRTLPAGQLPNDVRLEPLKDLDGYFPFVPASTQQRWDTRADRVRRQILVSLGLWPLPTKTPLNPVVYGKITRDDYTVEKVYFESVPGFYVTGNLYRPRKVRGKTAGVLCPHGHWNEGRFMDQGAETVQKEIASGAERFEEGGRSVLQARCVQLARMGCTVFHYDMIGYADSVQIPMEIAHGFKTQRPEMNTTNDWGLFSPQAESHLQSVMGLQTWNSIRALDFLQSLPEVDPERIACTGASGGGTQTFILSAIDPRIKVAFPAVMVSTAMQGGCTCENACDLRIGTGNVEFAALFAPKPLGMTAADDWTKEMPTKGFPELKQHYEMLGRPDQVMLAPFLQFGHNYNYVSRDAMYRWLNSHLHLGITNSIVESNYTRLTKEEMTVWDKKHPKPEGGPEFERRLLRWLTDDADHQLEAVRSSSESFRKVAGPAVDVLIGRNLSEVGDVAWTIKSKSDRGRYFEMPGLVRNVTHGEELPVVFLYPKTWNKQTVIWLDGAGKQGLFDPAKEGEPIQEVRRLLDAGATVVGIDLLYQGEFLTNGKAMTQTRQVKNPREAAAYTFGYNHTLFAQRVHDILTVIKYVVSNERQSEKVDLVGVNSAGPWVVAARIQAGDAIHRSVIDTGGFRFGNVLKIHSTEFLPGGAKYGDLPGMIALGDTPALVLGEDKRRWTVDSKADYAGRSEKANVAVDWLLK